MNLIEINRQTWDKRAEIHYTSEMYDTEGFINGECKLKEIELNELPDVGGKSLLHLQCHFGIDTLSWARRGAEVTGVDFSPVAIKQANELKKRCGLEADFVCASIQEFSGTSDKTFDIVFVSYGALCWLPDVKDWANIVSNNLKPGGTLSLIEMHPMHAYTSGYPYFHRPEPDEDEEGTYTENCSGEKMKFVTWSHPISEVINAIIEAGIRVDNFKEYPFLPHNCYENLEEKEPGRFFLTGTKHHVPMLYSIKGTKTSEQNASA